MRPYAFPGGALRLAIVCVILAGSTLGTPAEKPRSAAASSDQGRSKKPLASSPLGQPRLVLPRAPSSAHPATVSGFQHYYDLELDAAVRDFERAYADHSQDPFAVNHLLAAVLVRELVRVGALDSSLYSSNSFITRKEYVIDPAVRERVQDLSARSIGLCDARLEHMPADADALYARGVARSLLAAYQGVLERAWFAALRSAHEAREDHEEVLDLSPGYADAKTVVGIHNYIAGSMPWTVKLALSLTGMSGSKSKGLTLLAEAAAAHGVTAIDARIALALFLRREQQYDEALPVVQQLTHERPRNFYFALEEGNILNAAGEGTRAAAAYRQVLEATARGKYAQPRPELAAYGLGEALRGQRQFLPAAQAYDRVQGARPADAELTLRACLAAGEMYDALGDRDHAVVRYRTVLRTAPADSAFHSTARKRLKEPFKAR